MPNFLNAWASSVGSRPNPRKESFLQMLKFTFCPSLKFHSFIVLITLTDILIFLSCDGYSIYKYQSLNSNVFLGPTNETFEEIKKDPYQLRVNYQAWRLITPIFLHMGFVQLVTTMLSQIIFGSILEAMIGFSNTFMVYFISG